MTRILQRLALKTALKLVVWTERRMKSQCGQLAVDDARLEIQMCLNTFFR